MDGMQEFEAKASEVAAILKAVANERRLMLLCKLLDMGEANVGTLAEAVGLSQSALSQHLTVLREQGIVAYRRESQTLWYRIADPRIEALFGHFRACSAHRRMGPPLGPPPQRRPPEEPRPWTRSPPCPPSVAVF